jgi:flagellar hook assembly protein FlgD
MDASGRVLWRLEGRAGVAGENRLIWDGRRTNGSQAPPGVYFIRVQAEGQRTAKVLRIQ